MAATRNDISEWFDVAVASKKFSHMLVVCDTFDWNDYPVYIEVGEDVEAEISRLDDKNMQKVMEVYDLSLDKNAQMNEDRAWHVSRPKLNEAGPLPVAPEQFQIYALLSEQGSAMGETALCSKHQSPAHVLTATEAAVAEGDWDMTKGWTDCTGNEELHCIICGAPSTVTDFSIVGYASVSYDAQTDSISDICFYPYENDAQHESGPEIDHDLMWESLKRRLSVNHNIPWRA